MYRQKFYKVSEYEDPCRRYPNTIEIELRAVRDDQEEIPGKAEKSNSEDEEEDNNSGEGKIGCCFWCFKVL